MIHISIMVLVVLVCCLWWWLCEHAMKEWVSWSAAYFELWKELEGTEKFLDGEKVIRKYFDGKMKPKFSRRELRKMREGKNNG